MHAASLSVPLAIALLLAGCAGGGATPAGQASSSIAAPTDIVEDGGSITGTVVDDESIALEGVTVALLELNLQVATIAAGAFEFQNLPAGTYRLAAQKLGYESVAKAVTVAAGEAADVTLELAAIAIEVARHEVVGPLSGYFQCRSSVYQGGATGTCGYTCTAACVNPLGPVFTGDNSILKFEIDSDNVASVVGDMKWTPSAYGTSSNLRFAFSYEKRVGSHWWCSGEGPSPLQFVWQADGESKCANVGGTTNPDQPLVKDNPMRIYSNVPFATQSSPLNLAYEQKFEMYGTVFYGEPAPEGYTALADG